MSPLMIGLVAFAAVVMMTFAIFSALGWFDAGQSKVEDRLQVLAGKKSATADQDERGLLKEDFAQLGGQAFASMKSRMESLGAFFEQANSPIDLQQFLLITAGCAVVGIVAGVLASAPPPLYPVFGLICAGGPYLWLSFRRGKRFSRFAKQLPEAMDMLGRALRSGHSLNSAIRTLSEEMRDPLAGEFRIAYEQQNLGMPIEQALREMLKRMPNLDLKFFVTAVAVQRQTGGDLAEILNKISHVIRERFMILGTVQALTAEGRLSGIVLMILPIAIFIAVYYLNPDYVMVLFTTELGRKMIGAGIFMQILGAYVINKIIDIKV